MSGYRDDVPALHARIASLEEALADARNPAKEEELERLRERVAELERPPPRARASSLPVVLAFGAILAFASLLAAGAMRATAPAEPSPAPRTEESPTLQAARCYSTCIDRCGPAPSLGAGHDTAPLDRWLECHKACEVTCPMPRR